MLPYHLYQWKEAVSQLTAGTNMQLSRLTCDVLLCAPMTLDSVKCSISDDQKVLEIQIKLPSTFLKPRRTAVRTVDAARLHAGVAPAAIPVIIDRAEGLSRVAAHGEAIKLYKKQTKGNISMKIALPFKVDKIFCRRDDFGIETGNAPGLSIATYQHEDPGMRATNQYIYILHVEMSAADREDVDPRSPTTFSTYHTWA